MTEPRQRSGRGAIIAVLFIAGVIGYAVYRDYRRQPGAFDAYDHLEREQRDADKSLHDTEQQLKRAQQDQQTFDRLTH